MRSVYLAVFSPPTHENLGTRQLHYQHNYAHSSPVLVNDGNVFNRYEKNVRKPFWAYAGIISIPKLSELSHLIQTMV